MLLLATPEVGQRGKSEPRPQQRHCLALIEVACEPPQRSSLELRRLIGGVQRNGLERVLEDGGQALSSFPWPTEWFHPAFRSSEDSEATLPAGVLDVRGGRWGPFYGGPGAGLVTVTVTVSGGDVTVFVTVTGGDVTEFVTV